MTDNKEGRKLLGQGMSQEEGIALAQLVNQPGWKIYVRLIAEACRNATEAVIKLDPSVERYDQKLAALHSKARAMSQFAADVLDSVKLHQRKAVTEAKRQEAPVEQKAATAPRFRMPMPELSSEDAKLAAEQKSNQL